MSHLFSPFTVRGLALRNRIVMSPMAMHSADEDGRASDWYLAHLGARAMGGVGLIMTEATAVQKNARMSLHHLGLWDDAQIELLARVVRLCKEQGAAMGIQLVHAGRKAWTDDKGAGPAVPVAPSALPFDTDWVVPRELTPAEIDCVVVDFASAAKRALAAGYDAVEIHAAHGYLLHEFLSPLSNQRKDEYGGPLENRARLLLRVVDTVRKIWPERQPLLVRLSCTDWAPGGLVVEDLVTVARWLAARGVDVVDCSSGGLAPVIPPTGPGYQVPFSE
jgi:NADPH2 dehydrogenase